MHLYLGTPLASSRQPQRQLGAGLWMISVWAHAGSAVTRFRLESHKCKVSRLVKYSPFGILFLQEAYLVFRWLSAWFSFIYGWFSSLKCINFDWFVCCKIKSCLFVNFCEDRWKIGHLSVSLSLPSLLLPVQLHLLFCWTTRNWVKLQANTPCCYLIWMFI